MNCLTGNDIDGNPVDLEIFGEAENVPHRRLEFVYKPCTPNKVIEGTVTCPVDLSNPNAYAEKL